MAKQVLNYYQRNKERIKARRRQTTLSTTGPLRFRNIKKRPRPDRCELCMSKANIKSGQLLLDYHHWHATRPDLGLWLCRSCHTFAGVMDKHGTRQRSMAYYFIKDEAEAFYLNRYPT